MIILLCQSFTHPIQATVLIIDMAELHNEMYLTNRLS